ncbi:MAG: rhomboid family intramembrane serine protease [Saprospiraceae bacterium]
MIFPYGDTNVPNGQFPIVNYVLIALNVVVFIFQYSMPQAELEAFVYGNGFIPADGFGLTVLTSIFMHGGFMHLLGNMMFLWLFGDNIEQTIGSMKYLLFYLFGGIIATIAHFLAGPESVIPAIGASGAIAAVMGAYLVCFPHSQIKMLWLFFPFRISAFLFLGFWIVQQLFSGTASLGGPTDGGGGVAWWAHIGGFLFGVAAGFYFRKYKQPDPPLIVSQPWMPRRVSKMPTKFR